MPFRLVGNLFHVPKRAIIACPVHHAAQRAGLFEQSDIMANFVCGDGIFHAPRTAARNKNALGPIGGNDVIIAVAAERGILCRTRHALVKNIAREQ